MASVAVGIVPVVGDVKDVQEAVTGRDLVSGEKLSGFDRVLAGGAAAVPVLSSKALRAAKNALLDGAGEASGTLFHYTDEAGAAGIKESGVIRPDADGRVFVTTYQVSASEANNTLFMGQGETKGSHVVEIQRLGDLPLEGGAQVNELVQRGAIRDGRHGTLTVKENEH